MREVPDGGADGIRLLTVRLRVVSSNEESDANLNATPTPRPVFRVLTVGRVVDGDTFDVVLDKYHGVRHALRTRLLEVDTWEITGEEKEWGIPAKNFTENWLISAYCNLVIEGERLDSFGRLLCWVYDRKTGECLNYRLVEEGHGKAVPLEVHLARFT